jgi:SAM-dependent methyltransferase
LDGKTIQYYDESGREIARRYESVPSPVEQYFSRAFEPNSSVLDIGAGSGRDMNRLQAHGFQVMGVEPSKTLRESAINTHPELIGRILEGSLPDLQLVGRTFDAVLCCAVLMHIAPSQLFDASIQIRNCLKNNGRLLISLPLTRGDTDFENRDRHGRLFSPYTPEEIETLFTRLGFTLISRWDSEDSLSRSGNTWFTQLFEYRALAGIRPLDQIEAILNRDRKEATYKLALFRALAEIAQTNERVVTWLPSGRVGIPLMTLAQCWLRYYWPIVATEPLIPQSNAEGSGGKALKFRADLSSLIDDYRQRGVYGGLTAWHLESQSHSQQASTAKKQVRALKSISQTILLGPVTHAGGALDGGAIFGFDPLSKQVLVPASIWQELVLMGHWISEAVILRWANLSAKFAARQGILVQAVLPLLLVSPEPERSTSLARATFEKSNPGFCTWTGKPLTSDFAVDHVIPFSLWGNNDLWNLVITDPRVNAQKSDSLPTLELIEQRRPAIFENWNLLRDNLPAMFDSQAGAFLGSSISLRLISDWETELFSVFKQSIELTAINRGVPRWSPNKPRVF